MIDGIHIRVEGLVLEKLIDRAVQDGISFLKVKRSGAREADVWLDEVNARRFLLMTERFSYRTQILERQGKSAAGRWLKARWSVLVAVALAGTIIWLFSTRIWWIDIAVEESRYAPVSIIEAALEELGIHPGVAQSAIDANALETALYEKTGYFAFIGVHLQGVRLRITAAGEVAAPELFDISADRDLVALRDGIVVSVQALAGTACVQAGDAVQAGQLLISGEERISAELTGGVCALGEVVAKTWHEGRAEARIIAEDRVYTGRKSTKSVLRFFGLEWQLTEGETYPLMEEKLTVFPIVGMFLPVQIARWERAEYEVVPRKLLLEDVKKEIAEIAYKNTLSELPEGCVIVDKWTDYSMIEEDRIQARVVIEVQSNIAGTRDALNAIKSPLL